MKVAAVQSNYIPWKGYFDMINSADLFVFYDSVQYTKSDWRNRNMIQTPAGTKWLTIPCISKHDILINEVEILNGYWQRKHLNSFTMNYSRSKYFKQYFPLFEEIYLGKKWTNLSDFNQFLIQKIAEEILSINTIFEDSRKYELVGKKEYRVLDLLKKCGATEFICGPKAKSYLKEGFLEREGIILNWMDYSNYPEYQQLHPPFQHKVSIIDLIFNEGPNAKYFMKSFNDITNKAKNANTF